MEFGSDRPDDHCADVQMAAEELSANSSNEAGEMAGAELGVKIEGSASPGRSASEVHGKCGCRESMEPSAGDLDVVMDIPLQATVEVGRADLDIRDLLSLAPGTIIALDKLIEEPFSVLVNRKLVARGEFVKVNEKRGVRLVEVVSRKKRIERLKAMV